MEQNKPKKISDYLANERTFLAWIRTAIGIMAFGFVVVKFALFLKQISYVLRAGTLPPSHGVSTTLGITLVGLGALIALLSFLRYRQVCRQIEEDNFKPVFSLSMALTLMIILVGLFLVFYLVQSAR